MDLSVLPHDAGLQAQQELARRHVLDWAILNEPTFERHPHMVLLCEYLESLERREIKRLIVQMPPQHAKSTNCSRAFPSWYIGRNPTHPGILCSYGADLANHHSRHARRWLTEHGKGTFDVSLRQDTQAVNAWETEQGGGLVSLGFSGPASGRGAKFLIIDDPYKDEQDAASPLIKQRVLDRWASVLRPRLHPDGIVLLVLTRWEHDDLAGHFLDQGGWELLSLPAIAEDDDQLGRETGTPLWHGADFYEEVREDVGSRVFDAMWQQRPTPDEGEVFNIKQIRYWDTLPGSKNGKYRFDDMIQSWDLTFDDGATADYVVGQVWGVKGLDRYLVHQVRGRWDIVETMRQIRLVSMAYPEANGKYIERAANGFAVVKLLTKEIDGIVSIVPKGSKVQRAKSVTPTFESGHVYLPHPDKVPWVGALIGELATFPRGKNDDQVDALSQALIRLRPNKRRQSGKRPSIDPVLASVEKEGF